MPALEAGGAEGGKETEWQIVVESLREHSGTGGHYLIRFEHVARARSTPARRASAPSTCAATRATT